MLLGHVDHLASFANKVELCDAALSDLLEHTDMYPGRHGVIILSQTRSFQVANSAGSGPLRICELEVVALHNVLAFVGEDKRATGEKTHITEMWRTWLILQGKR